jgi:RNA polymerase sigma-70 factor (ECF subfamily)
MRKLIKKYTENYHEIEEIEQRVNLKLLTKYQHYTDPQKKQYVKLLVHREYIDLYRKKKAKKNLIYVENYPELAIPKDPQYNDLENAIEQLSPKLKEVILLHYYFGLKFIEIADLLKLSLGTILSRSNYARQELRNRLRK